MIRLAFFVQSLGEFFVVIEKAYCNNMRWYTEAIYSSTFCNRGDPHARPMTWTCDSRVHVICTLNGGRLCRLAEAQRFKIDLHHSSDMQSR